MEAQGDRYASFKPCVPSFLLAFPHTTYCLHRDTHHCCLNSSNAPMHSLTQVHTSSHTFFMDTNSRCLTRARHTLYLHPQHTPVCPSLCITQPQTKTHTPAHSHPHLLPASVSVSSNSHVTQACVSHIPTLHIHSHILPRAPSAPRPGHWHTVGSQPWECPR